MADRERWLFRRVTAGRAGSRVVDEPSWHRVKEILEAALDRPPVSAPNLSLRTCGDEAACEPRWSRSSPPWSRRALYRAACASIHRIVRRLPAGWIPTSARIWSQGILSVHTRSSNLSAPGAWARFTGHVTASSIAMSRSRSDPSVRAGFRSLRAFPARSARARRAEPPEHRGDLRARRVRWRSGARAGARRRSDARESIARGRIPSSEALSIAKQIAEGLKRRTNAASFTAI